MHLFHLLESSRSSAGTKTFQGWKVVQISRTVVSSEKMETRECSALAELAQCRAKDICERNLIRYLSLLTKSLYKGVNQSWNSRLGRNELGLNPIAAHGFGGLFAEDCDGKLVQELRQLVAL